MVTPIKCKKRGCKNKIEPYTAYWIASYRWHNGMGKNPSNDLGENKVCSLECLTEWSKAQLKKEKKDLKYSKLSKYLE